MLTLTFEIRLESNYHVGAGYGKGFDLDSALLREADGTPVLRGSGLTGLLRDGTYRLLQLPPLAKHPADATLARLFGTPAQAKRWRIASARLAERRAADAQAVRRVRINPRTRRAEPGNLFSQEEGVAGQKFRFTVTCPQNDAAALDEAALLLAAARNVRQLGRSRRRGLGECVIHLTDVAGIDAEKSAEQSWEDWFLERFDRAWLQGSLAPVTAFGTMADIRAIRVSGGAAVRAWVVVRLDEPLLIAERASAGNQFDTRPFIPGSVLLGALAGLAAERCDLAESKAYHDFVALFLRGVVTFPMLYPAYHYSDNLYPTIPAPFGLMTCSVVPLDREQQGHGAHQAGTHERCPECNKQECSNRLEPVGGFVALKRQGPYTFSPTRASELHIHIDEKTGRVTQGDLYGYTVLDAGQYFVGELLCADEAAWTRLQAMTGLTEKTPLTWRIGKARRRGYGQVTAWLERCDSRPAAWTQLTLEQRVPDLTQPLSLTLLTDAIIANTWGQQATGFAEEWLARHLGLGPLEIQDAYARARMVDSFNAYLGLPRWRDTALTAGSVVWVKVENPPADWRARLQRVETEGIGLRRNEGFGRIAFNHPVYNLCRDVQDSHISLPDAMRLVSERGWDAFVQPWEEELEKHLPKKRRLDPRFAALARWLHTRNYESPETLLGQLGAIGQPDSDLIEAVGGQNEYGQRSKANFFQTDGKKGIEAISKTLKHLHEKEEGQNWSRGIERLAEWLAALAGDEKQGGAQ